jgi:hypothetical protein
MNRKKREPYTQPGRGQVEIENLRTKATWEEIGERESHHAGPRSSEQGVEGRKFNVQWRIIFGQISGSKREALRDILRQRAADERTRFTVVLNGVKHDSLYLSELTVDRYDPIPCGLVFSSSP